MIRVYVFISTLFAPDLVMVAYVHVRSDGGAGGPRRAIPWTPAGQEIEGRRASVFGLGAYISVGKLGQGTARF